MGKFIYNMESILRIKYKLEDQAKNAYAIAKRKLDEEEDKLNYFIARRDGYENNLRTLVVSKLNVWEIKKCEDAIETMKYSIKMQQVIVKQAEFALEKERLKMQEAMVERKTHEKLKENAFEVFVQEEKHQESKEIDELVSFKYNNTYEDV